MSDNGNQQVTQNGSVHPPKKSESFDTMKVINKYVSPSNFDKFCIVLAEVLGTASLMFFGCAGTVPW